MSSAGKTRQQVSWKQGFVAWAYLAKLEIPFGGFADDTRVELTALHLELSIIPERWGVDFAEFVSRRGREVLACRARL